MKKFLSLVLSVVFLMVTVVEHATCLKNSQTVESTSGCFPALGFQMPSKTPDHSYLKQWWCDDKTEYAFMGFSYEVSACKRIIYNPLRRCFDDPTRSKL